MIKYNLGWYGRLLSLTTILLSQASHVEAWFAGNNGMSIIRSKQAPPTVPKNGRILILPGFGNESSDYYLEKSIQGSLVSSLVQRGWDLERQIRVLPVQRSDWLQVFWKGAFDHKFWQGTAPPTRPAFQWYIKRIADCVSDLTSATSDDGDDDIKVILVGHSAGGWLARAALGYGSTGDDENEFPSCIDLNKIGGVVTLGAPHSPPPPEIMDMTRGALKLTSANFPGAYHNELFYVTVMGDAVTGMKQERKNPFEPTTVTGFAYNSYAAVCGIGEEVGDGVVPVIAGHLDGALCLNLKGIFHSINVPDRWYGSDSVLDDWHQEMLQEFYRVCSSTKGRTQTNPFNDIFR